MNIIASFLGDTVKTVKKTTYICRQITSGKESIGSC